MYEQRYGLKFEPKFLPIYKASCATENSGSSSEHGPKPEPPRRYRPIPLRLPKAIPVDPGRSVRSASPNRSSQPWRR